MSVEDNVGYFRAEQLIELTLAAAILLRILVHRNSKPVWRSTATAIPHPKWSASPYPKPEYGNLYTEIFRCPVEFNSDRLEWQFDATSLYSPLPYRQYHHAADVSEIVWRHVGKSQCVHQPKRKSLSNATRETWMLPFDRIYFIWFGMSSRTLRRHLKAADTSYQKILDHVRFHLLDTTFLQLKMSIEEISERVGFSDSANFDMPASGSGSSPRQYRKEVV